MGLLTIYMNDKDQSEEIRKIVESDSNINTLFTDFINKINMKGLCNVDFGILGGFDIRYRRDCPELKEAEEKEQGEL